MFVMTKYALRNNSATSGDLNENLLGVSKGNSCHRQQTSLLISEITSYTLTVQVWKSIEHQSISCLHSKFSQNGWGPTRKAYIKCKAHFFRRWMRWWA